MHKDARATLNLRSCDFLRASGSAYNQPVVPIFLSFRSRRLAALFALFLALLSSVAIYARAQNSAEATTSAGGRILLVLPLDNRTGQPSLEWIREGAAEILSSRLASAGFAPMSRADRRYALDHLGLPQGFHPSRASSLKLAETLDVDSIIVGSYVTDGAGIIVEARVVDVPHLRMGDTVTAHGDMRELIPVLDSLAWKITRQLDPGFSGSEETFVAASSTLGLAAFEQYIRGISESDQTERLRHLNSAVLLNSGFGQAWMALGREEYAGQQYEQAGAAFAKVGDSDPDDALEANFYRGLSLLFSGDYPRAEDAFAAVARVLPLAEVLNNQGVAVARRGQDGIPLFRQAAAADPNGADYYFNLAVSLKRRGETAEALTELAQCLRLHPNDTEAQAVQRAWTKPAKPGSAKSGVVKPLPAMTPSAQPAAANEPTSQEAGDSDLEAEAKPDPLERIERSFDAVAFHQAALMLDQVADSRLAALSPQERALKLSAQAKDYLDRGLLLEAERLYQSALAADSKSVAAHAGIAQIRERTGDLQAARKEAVTSLQIVPSVDAYLVLIRLDIAANHLGEARQNADAALRLDPKSQPALEIKRQIEAQQALKK
jgi:tetratricopeptide (TPR) repeat protein